MILMIVSYENNVTLLTSYCTNCEKKKEKIVSVTLRDKVIKVFSFAAFAWCQTTKRRIRRKRVDELEKKGWDPNK